MAAAGGLARANVSESHPERRGNIPSLGMSIPPVENVTVIVNGDVTDKNAKTLSKDVVEKMFENYYAHQMETDY